MFLSRAMFDVHWLVYDGGNIFLDNLVLSAYDCHFDFHYFSLVPAAGLHAAATGALAVT